jgi:hypothetical protein
MTNIWEVTTVSDIVKILKSNPKKFVILGFSLVSAPKTEHKLIKKFLKDKAKLYPNMTFLFFKVEKNDLGKISLLDSNVDSYPWIYHVYDYNNIFIKVNNANEETIYKSFEAGEQYYKKDLEEYLDNNTVNNKTSNQTEDKTSTKGENKTDDIDKNAWEQQQMMIEKLLTFQNKAKKYNLELLEDIKQRKKEEEKIRREK